MVSPCGTVPPYVLGQPAEPTLNGRGSSCISVLGQVGFPMMSLPAGFTSYVYDRVRDPSAPGGTKLIGPVPAVLPVALTIYARPFGEPTLFKVASAYQRAFPEVRVPPPDFGPLSGEP
jgi:Asp-tRNA(Asn)/Glu-tRNA(Gln) amidotransferase A subunit family amidase